MRTLIAAGAVVLACAASADAATVSIDNTTLRYAAGSGERNAPQISREPAGFRVVDPGVPVTAGAGCTTAGPDSATCTGVVTDVFAGLGSRVDSVDVSGLGLPATLEGGSGSDTLVAGVLNDTLNGGANADTMTGGLGDDRMAGQSGRDTLFGGEGNDRLIGDFGDDVLQGEGGSDRLFGQQANDTLRGGFGPDVLDGGAGEGDHADYSDRTEPLFVDFDGAANDGSAAEGDRVSTDVEAVTGGTAGDRLTATAGNKRLRGGPGDDRLRGGAGNDVLDGEDGDDTLNGGSLADAIDGGDGTDLVDYSGSVSSVRVDLAAGTGRQIRGAGFGRAFDIDRLSGLENARGTDLGDRLRGDSGRNMLIGGRGNDVLDGDLGADVMEGGGGRDRADYRRRRQGLTVTLDGVADDGGSGEEDNVLPSVEGVLGGAGRDSFTGNRRANRLVGRGGADTLVGEEGNDRLYGGGDRDTIRAGTGSDRIRAGRAPDSIDAGPGGDRLLIRDGRADTAACGDGTDTAIADDADRLSGCERTRRR